jgi:predicted transcriptional regulator of viral defense system
VISGISEKNRVLLDMLTRSFKGPFSTREVSSVLDIPENDIRIKLGYLARKGWLSRVKQGLYITIPLGTVNPKEYKEHPWIVANRLYDPCYIGGWSAAEHWEFTDQIFNSIVVFTLHKFKKKYTAIQGTDFILRHSNTKYFGKTKSVWIENTKISVSDPVQTIVDILDDPAVGGGMRNVADIIKYYFKSNYRDDSSIKTYIKVRRNKTVFKRLGYLIELFEIDAVDLMNDCKANISAGYTLLDPSIESKGSYNSKWNLRINSELTK